LSQVDRLLEASRRRLDRVDPVQAHQIVAEGGLLIDIRPAAQRAEFGEVPGALVVERNNLEWRLDPDGTHRLDDAADGDRPVVIMCQEGFASSLAAASLLDLGRTRATDLVGGFAAWQAAGLPTVPAPRGGPDAKGPARRPGLSNDSVSNDSGGEP
jgi:rhodanese-related sulfurtransferase